MYKRTVLIDLDGVLNEYTQYEEGKIPDIRKGAKKFLEKLSTDFELILFTTRGSKLALEWLQKNKIDKYFKDVTNIKSPAYILIDDRAICFRGNFDNILKEINDFKPYRKEN